MAIILRILISLALITLAPVIQNPSPNDWSVSLAAGSEIINVRLDGSWTQQQFIWDFPPAGIGTTAVPAFSHETAAYCVQDQALKNNARLVVIHLDRLTPLLDLDLGVQAKLNCQVTRFSNDGKQVFVGLTTLYNSVEEATKNDSRPPLWKIIIVNVGTGAIVSDLDFTQLNVEENKSPGRGQLPIALNWHGSEVTFAFTSDMEPEGADPAPAYTWNLTTGEVVKVTNRGKQVFDSLGNGEFIWPDLQLPFSMPSPIYLNKLQYINSTANSHTIFQTDKWGIRDARFVNDGKQIMIQLVRPKPSYTSDFSPKSIEYRLVLLNRDGTYQDALPITEASQYDMPINAPGGYIAFKIDWIKSNDEYSKWSRRVLALEYHVDDSVRTLWTPRDDEKDWRIVWSTPTETHSLPPFQTIP